MKKELHLFLAALTFYTRIPCKWPIDYEQAALNKASRYFPLIGYLVGFICFGVYVNAEVLFSDPIAILLALAAGILTTGAFHEDGLADFFDGFGGGWTKSKILEIMKDSRVGTYGMVATVLQLALKFAALLALLPYIKPYGNWAIALLFISYHALARLAAITVSYVLPYVREDELSKAKPIAKSVGKTEIGLSALLGLMPLIALGQYQPYVGCVLVVLLGLIAYMGYYLRKWIGGYTGDCLGAVEQLAEVLIVLTFLAVWNCM